MLAENMNLTCSVCDCLIWLSFNDNKNEDTLQAHFNSNCHRNNLIYHDVTRTFNVDCNLCNVFVRIETRYHDLTRLMYHLRDEMHLDNINDYYYSEEDFSDGESYESPSPSFYCIICHCNVPMAVRSNNATLGQIWSHIKGYRHRENQNNNDYKNILGCNLCQCYLQLSYDANATMRNISTHINGYRHLQNLWG